MHGLALIGRLRAKGNATPALILSALGAVDDRVRGLRAGGDDYLPKPYSFSELLARVEVLARRHTGRGEETAPETARERAPTLEFALRDPQLWELILQSITSSK